MAGLRRKLGLFGSLVLAIALSVVPKYWDWKIESVPPLVPPPVTNVPKSEVVEDTIQKNTTLVATLVDYNIPSEIAKEVASLVRPVFDLRKLRFGNPFKLEREFDGTLKAFEYKIDDESILKVHKDADSYAAKVEKLDLETHEATITAEIHSSLWEALDDVPKREYLATELAEMFQWQVDFSTEMQPGDQIRLLVDESLHDGNFVKYGKIKAAELVNSGHRYRGFLFNDSYYDEKGISLKRAMLASPLKFTPRVTSAFHHSPHASDPRNRALASGDRLRRTLRQSGGGRCKRDDHFCGLGWRLRQSCSNQACQRIEQRVRPPFAGLRRESSPVDAIKQGELVGTGRTDRTGNRPASSLRNGQERPADQSGAGVEEGGTCSAH